MKRFSLLTTAFLLLSATLFSQGTTISVNDDITLVKLRDGFYMHTTISESPTFGRYPSNGLLVIRNGKAFMIDSPVTNKTTNEIIRYLSDYMSVELVLFTGGHYHEDCIGSMAFIKEIGVKTFLSTRTREKCIQYNLPLPDTTFDESYIFSFEGIPVECRFVGGGHASDNSIVYFPEQEILFGGCLVKNNESQNLGNLNDAVVDQWKPTMEKLINLYPSVKIIVPGHGNFGGKEMFTHTIELIDRHLENK